MLFHQGSGMAIVIHVGGEENHADADSDGKEMCR